MMCALAVYGFEDTIKLCFLALIALPGLWRANVQKGELVNLTG